MRNRFKLAVRTGPRVFSSSWWTKMGTINKELLPWRPGLQTIIFRWRQQSNTPLMLWWYCKPYQHVGLFQTTCWLTMLARFALASIMWWLSWHKAGSLCESETVEIVRKLVRRNNVWIFKQHSGIFMLFLWSMLLGYEKAYIIVKVLTFQDGKQICCTSQIQVK